jgi:ribosome-associated translation inhibitor RaiA
MLTNITARHCDVSDDLRQRADAVLARLGALHARASEATVLFDIGPTSAIAELRFKGERGDRFVARGEDRDHRSALDRAEEKLRRQIERGTSLRRSRRTRDTV